MLTPYLGPTALSPPPPSPEAREKLGDLRDPFLRIFPTSGGGGGGLGEIPQRGEKPAGR